MSRADDVTITYLSHIVQYLHHSNIDQISITIKDVWSASSRTWRALDDELLRLSTGTVRFVTIRHETPRAPPADMFPFRCINDFRRKMMRKCVYAGVAVCFCPDHVTEADCVRELDDDSLVRFLPEAKKAPD